MVEDYLNQCSKLPPVAYAKESLLHWSTIAYTRDTGKRGHESLNKEILVFSSIYKPCCYEMRM